MGCGSSTVKPPMGVVPPAGVHGKAAPPPSTQQQQQAPPKTVSEKEKAPQQQAAPTATPTGDTTNPAARQKTLTSHPSNSSGSTNAPASISSSANQQQHHPPSATSPLPPPTRPAQLAPLKNAPRRLMCDNDTKHVASVRCEDCEENFCAECDQAFHARKKTKDHVRKPIVQPTTLPPVQLGPNKGLPLTASSPGFGSPPLPNPMKPKLVKASSVVAESPKPRYQRASTALVKSSPHTKVGVGIQSQQQGGGPQGPGGAANGNNNPVPAAAQEKFINVVPVEKLRSLGGAQLNIIWQQYDINGDGVLDKSELKLLASDCIERTLKMFEDEIRRQNPGIGDSDLRDAVERERAIVLPGKKKEDSHKEMIRMLVRRLDVNNDGSVTKAELMMQWNSFAKDLFAMRKEGALDCSIM